MDPEKRADIIAHVDEMVVGVHTLGLMLLCFAYIADPETADLPQFMLPELIADARSTVDEMFEAVGVDRIPYDDPEKLVTELVALMFRLEMMTDK